MNAIPNKNETQNYIVLAIIAATTAWAGSHGIDASTWSSMITSFVPIVIAGLAGGYSFVSNWNQKKVPETSTALHIDGQAQPVGTTVPASVVAAAKVVGMLAAFLLAGLLVTPSFAAANKPLNIDPLHLINKPAVNTAATAPAAAPTTPLDALTNLINQIEGIQPATITNVIADITAANADASTIVTPATPTTPAIVKDPISAACYPAAIHFLQSLPVATPPTGTLIGVQLFQKKRDFIAQIQAGLPVYLKLGCAPLLGDEITTFVNLMAMVGVKILPAAATALMPALAPITLPALTLAP